MQGVVYGSSRRIGSGSTSSCCNVVEIASIQIVKTGKL